MPAVVRPGRNVAGISGTNSPSGPVRPSLTHPLHIDPPPLRTANGHHLDERRTSWLELFFDLVFAGAVGQLAGWRLALVRGGRACSRDRAQVSAARRLR
jgi:hypothetical protein